MKILYLLRHAKAEPGSKVTGDMDRVLAARGREAAALIGAYMHAKTYAPAYAFSSPSARTRETFELVTEAAGLNPKYRFEDTLYLATAEEILRVIQTAADDIPSLMVIGHNPGMHHMALMLSTAKRTTLRTALELKYPTGTLAVLRFECDRWQEVAIGAGALVDFITPSEL